MASPSLFCSKYKQMEWCFPTSTRAASAVLTLSPIPPRPQQSKPAVTRRITIQMQRLSSQVESLTSLHQLLSPANLTSRAISTSSRATISATQELTWLEFMWVQFRRIRLCLGSRILLSFITSWPTLWRYRGFYRFIFRIVKKRTIRLLWQLKVQRALRLHNQHQLQPLLSQLRPLKLQHHHPHPLLNHFHFQPQILSQLPPKPHQWKTNPPSHWPKHSHNHYNPLNPAHRESASPR